MKIHIANISDIKNLAKAHYICSGNQEQGFMYHLGYGFFEAYYKILLKEKNTVAICAETDDGEIIGLVTGSILEEEHAICLKKNRFKLLLAALPALVKNPKLCKDLFLRSKLESAETSENGFIVLTGPRLEYWGWLPEHRETMGAVELLKVWLKIVAALGCRKVVFEVDRNNLKSEKIHLILGAKITHEIITPDGRKRGILEYTLNEDEIF